jgi:peptide alpha-N-acetyltransferase
VNGDAEGAVGVLDSYLDTCDKDSVEFQKNFESSELALYKNQVLSETKGEVNGEGENGGLGGIRKAYHHLDEIKDIVVDQTGWLMTRLSYQLQLGYYDKAKETVFSLFERGSTEDHRVHGAYMCSLLKADKETCVEVGKLKGTATLATLRPLEDEERNILLAAYGTEDAAVEDATTTNGDSTIPKKGLRAVFPKSAAIKRIYLTLLPTSGEEFKAALDEYCQRQIVKGVPSLGSDLSSLYLIQEEKQQQQKSERFVLAKHAVDVKSHTVYQLLVQLVESYIASLESTSKFPNNDTEHSPSVLLWSWYLRAILHDQAAEYAPGISLINKCIEHTPTAVDFYELKAHLLENGGDIQKAADVIDAGRDLDHQDRYINNQTTKTLLRAGREVEASKTISMFTRHEGNPEQNLYDIYNVRGMNWSWQIVGGGMESWGVV